MASLVPGYEYDIFISYRQKDNKHDGWVTEFVNNLKGELEATFKEDVSVYFDINPHDGLLETHDVNASLKEKLKCLIFIPIISQTYCDSKSYAWQHEFIAFNRLAKEDQFGRDIRLAGGNVASRILPVKIHDLEQEDKTLLENELGVVLRSIDFIYKSPGVNRPLRANEDHPQDNLNKTYYRDQINKVANAVKEIISAIKKHDQQGDKVQNETVNEKVKRQIKFKPKIVIVSAVALVIVMLGFFMLPKLLKPSTFIEKSIAVLPFFNDSPDQENTYFINGIMDEVLNNLQLIKDFRVLSRTSTEQYRGSDRPSIPKIGKALDVNYIVEGSGQKYGNKIVLRVQLIAVNNERHLWAKSFEKEILATSDQITIQSEIAQSIASELDAVITPEVKLTIEKIPTTNLTAYDFYQRGKDEYMKYWIDNSNLKALDVAESFYKKAVYYDSTFAEAYTGLAMIYWGKSFYKEYFSKNFLDSILVYTNIALSYNNKLAEAYYVRGRYYYQKGNPKQALEEFDKAIKLNPNDWMAYYGKGEICSNDDLVMALENLQKAASLNHGLEVPLIKGYLSISYFNAGFIDKSKDYAQEVFKLINDSVRYCWWLGSIEYNQSNYKKAIEFYLKGYSIDSTYIETLADLGYCYSILKQFKESLKYYRKYIERKQVLGQFDLNATHRIAYSYWQNGYRKEAEYYFDKQIEYCNKSIQNQSEYAAMKSAYFDLAGVYAFRENKEKAYENLKIVNTRQRIPLWLTAFIKDDPLFNSIRNEPEFQQIVSDMESKYQAEHERVRKWLEEQGMM